MSLIKLHCPNKKCKKVARELSSSVQGKYRIVKLECGHSLITDSNIAQSSSSGAVQTVNDDSLVFLDGCKPYKYQDEGIELAEKILKATGGIVFGDEMRLGKFQPLDSIVMTPTGQTTMGNLKVEDSVIGSNGLPTKVEAIYPQGLQDVYEVVFSDGSKTQCGDDHLWQVNTALRKWQGAKPFVKMLKEIKNDLFTSSVAASGKRNNKWFIPLTKPVEFENQQLLIDPYVLGLLIGDGHIADEYRLTFATVDDDILIAVMNEARRQGASITQANGCNYRINSNAQLRGYLKSYGLIGKKSNDKFVPNQYKINSIENRLATLQGLMDTDGSIWKNGVVEYTTVSSKLAEDVKFLVQSLGGTVRTTMKMEPKYTYKGETLIGQPCYRLMIALNINPFRLGRKMIQWTPRKKYQPTRAIVAVNYLGKKECQCIKVAAADSLYATDEFILTHNTIQVLGVLRRNAATMLPAIGIVKASTLIQWNKEAVRVLNTHEGIEKGKANLVQIFDNKFHEPLPGFALYLFSYDTLPKFDLEKLKEKIKPKFIFFDECQQIKNDSAQRTKACQELTFAGDSTIPYRAGISGTWIKNNAAESYPIFNLIQPLRFNSKKSFEDTYVDSYITASGIKKYQGIKPERLDDWKQLLSEFVIRRERKDVLPDLPPINRTFFYTPLGEVVQKMYTSMLKKFQEAYDEMGGTYSTSDRANLLSFITKMRHITGIAKVEPCLEWIGDFLEGTEDRLTVFVHHQDVGEMLYRQCQEKGYNPLKYVASMNFEQRSEVMEKFKRNESRLMIASMLAAGEGVTFPPCQIVMLERQWNPANEEQAEARPVKIDGSNNQVNATYFLATGTIDEYFANLVEDKRKILKQTMRGDGEIKWHEESLMMELVDMLARNGGKRWKGW